MTSQRTKMGCLIINQKKQYLYRGLNPIGRNMDATIIIKQKEISIHHAIITIIDEQNQFISDMKSSNGTFLENKHLSPYELFKLDDQAKIKFSNITAVYLKMDNEDLYDIINTPSTESLTQTFFGAQTQIMENTRTEAIENNNKPDSQNSNGTIRESTTLNEIETQILETNHISINEMQTQIIPSYYSQPSIHEMQTEDLPITQRDSDNLFSENSVRELEAEVFPETPGSNNSTPKDEIHEMPTQLITDKIHELNGNNATGDIIENLSEIVDHDSDGQSQLHTSQLRKLSRSYRLNSDDEKEENFTISRKRGINLDNVPQCSETKDEPLPQTSKSLEKTIEHEEKGYSDSSNTDIDEDKLRTRKKGNFKKKRRTSKFISSSSEDSDFEFREKKRLTIISENDSVGQVVKTNNTSSEPREKSRLDDDCSSSISTDLEEFEKIQTERTQRVSKTESDSKDTHIVNIDTQIEDNKSDVSTDIEEDSKEKNDSLVGSRKTNTSVSFPIIEDDSSTDVEGNLKITKLCTSCITNPEETHIGLKTKSINTSIPNIEDDSKTDVEVDETKSFSNSRISDFDESYVKRSNIMDESEIIPETQEVFNKNFKPQQQKNNSYLDLSEIIPCTQDFSSEEFSLKMRGSSDENKEQLECIEERTESGSVLEDNNKVSKREADIKKGKDAVEDDFMKSFLEDSNDSVDFLAATQVIVNSADKLDSSLIEFSFGKRGKSAENNDGLEGQEVNFESPTQKNCIIMDKNVENDFFAPTQKIFPQVSEFKKSIAKNISMENIPSTSKDSNLEICLTDINSQDFLEDFYDQTQKVDQKLLMGIKEQKLENEEFDYDAPTQKIALEPNLNILSKNIEEHVDDRTKEIKLCTLKDSKLDSEESKCGIHSDSFNFEAATEKIVIELKENDVMENKGETTRGEDANDFHCTTQNFNSQSMTFNIQDNLKDFVEDFDVPSTKVSDNSKDQNIQQKEIDSSNESNLDVRNPSDLETQSFDFDIATLKIIEENVTEISNKSTETNQSLEDKQTFDFDGPTQTISFVNQNKDQNQENNNIIGESVNGENNVKAKEDFDITKKILPSTSTSNLGEFKSLNEWETQEFDFNAPTQKIIIENLNQVNEQIEPNDDMKNLIILETQTCDFDGPTQKIFFEDTKDGYQVVNVDNVTNEKVLTPIITASLINLEEKLSNLSNMEAQSFDFNAPTQKIDTEQKLYVSEDKMENLMENVSILSTNIRGSLIKDNFDVDSSRKHCEGNSSEIKDRSDDEIDYSAPTQMILPIAANSHMVQTKIISGNDGDYSASTQMITSSNMNLQENTKEDDADFYAPTQKIIPISTKKSMKEHSKNDTDDVDYSSHTKIIDLEISKNITTEKPTGEESDDDVNYCAPTQKIVVDKSICVEISNENSDNDSVDYSVPTQKILDEKTNEVNIGKSKQDSEDDDVDYSAPTQKVIKEDVSKKVALESEEDEVDYSAPTQKIIEDKFNDTAEKSKEDLDIADIDYSAPTQKIVEDKPTESNNYDYFAPTQKIIFEGSKIDSDDDDDASQKRNNSMQENAKQNVNNDDFDYSAPTQIVDEPVSRENQNEDFEFSAPTQKIFENPSETTENVSNIFQENSDFASSTQEIPPETICPLPQKNPVSILSPRNTSANSSPKKSVSFSQIENIVTIDKNNELESQMEVIFETQNVHLIPQDEERPSNPIADVLKDITTQDVVDILGEEVSKKRTSEDSDEENDSKRRKTSHKNKTSKKSDAKGKKKRVEVDEPKNKRMTRSEVKVEGEMKDKIVDKNCGDGVKKIEKDMTGGVEKVEENVKKNVSNKGNTERINEKPVRRSTRRTSVEERESSKIVNMKSNLNPIVEEPSTSKNIPKISCISINELLSPSRKFRNLSMKKAVKDNDDTDEEFEEPGEKALHIINLDDDVMESNKRKLASTMEEILLKSQRQTRNVTKNKLIKISEKSDVKLKDIEKLDDVNEENDFESKQEATIVENKTENRIESFLDKEEVSFKNQSKDADSERIEERPIENVSETILFDEIEESIGERMKIRSRKKVDKKEIPKKTVKTNQTKAITQKNITQKSFCTFNNEKINIKVPKRQPQLVISDDEQLDKFLPILDVNTKKKRGRKPKIEDEVFVPVASTSKESPKKTKKEEIEDVTLLPAPKRNKRTLKHKVVFTMCDDPELHTIIKYLGGSIVDSVDNCTVLVTNSILRTQKLLTAVGQGKPICSPTWLYNSKKANKFMDPWENLISDPESEKKWNFTLQESFNRSRVTKLFHGYSFQLLISTAAEVLKGAIENSGGKVVSRAPKSGEFFIVSSRDNKSKYSKFVNKGIKVVTAEAIFDGVLRQELVFHEHYLS